MSSPPRLGVLSQAHLVVDGIDFLALVEQLETFFFKANRTSLFKKDVSLSGVFT